MSSISELNEKAGKNTENNTNTSTPNADSQGSQIRLHRIYTKSSLFEAASLTVALLENPPQPVISLQVFSNAYAQDKQIHEAVLSLNLSAKHNDSLLWRVQVQQAGLYSLEGFTEEQQKQVLNIFCMSQLYPYACVAISNQVTQGGFAPVYLSPINFEELYKQQMQSKTPEAVV